MSITIKYNQAQKKEEILFRLAAGILLHKKEISFSEIQSLPIVGNNEEVKRIIDRLTNSFNTQIHNKKIASRPTLRWDTIVRLLE